MIKKLLSCLMITGFLMAGVAQASHDLQEDFLRNKGYSPETTRTILTQKDRQEWKVVPQKVKTIEDIKARIKHNIEINDWMGSFDDFGSTVIRERQ